MTEANEKSLGEHELELLRCSDLSRRPWQARFRRSSPILPRPETLLPTKEHNWRI